MLIIKDSHIKEEKLKRRVMDNLGIGLDEARRVASSVVSIKVSAIKPLGIIKIHENLIYLKRSTISKGAQRSLVECQSSAFSDCSESSQQKEVM